MYDRFQQIAIDTRDKDMIVSAGAGSGKTSVMIEKIAGYLIDGTVNIDELLVVTFTNAAASEMRRRLESKLNEKLLLDLPIEQHQRIVNQVELLGQSDICTLHKFCQTIIQKYFYTIDLDPSFAVGDETETAVLRARALNDLLEREAEKGDADFMLLANTFDDKRNFNKIKDYVYKIHEFLTNLPNVEEFKERALQALEGDLDKNKLTQIINKYVIEVFEYYYTAFSEARTEAKFIGYEELEQYLTPILSDLARVSPNNTFSQNHHFVYAFPTMKDLRISTFSPESTELKEAVGKLKKDFTDKLKYLRTKVLVSEDLVKVSHDLKDTRRALQAMFKIVERFESAYLKAKKERNILDFSDLEHYCYKILQNPETRHEVQARYKLIFVDEYQDINDVQEGIIAMVHTERDLFLVGDIKQSIYGFRGTNPQIFLDKKIAFSSENDDTVAVDFKYNYRTDRRVLDFVNFVFGKLMTKELGEIDYLPDNEMISENVFLVPNSRAPVEIDIVYKERKNSSSEDKLPVEEVYRVSTAPTVVDEERDFARSEGVIIAEKITQIMAEQRVIYDAKLKAEREIEFNDITLLCRSRSNSVNIILDTLAEYGIPVAQLEKDSVFSEYEVQILFAYLNLVHNPCDDINLTILLHSPIVGLTEDELARVRSCAPARDNYYECVLDYARTRQDDLSKKINYALDLIEKGANRLINDNIYNLLNWFVEYTHFIAYISALADGQNRVKNVYGYINGFNGKKYNTDLGEYLANVEEKEEEPEISPERTVGANVVKVETMHHSKGLEYPIVFLIDTGHGFNKEDKKGDFLLNNQLGVGMYKYDDVLRTKNPTISLSALKIAIDNKNFADNLRLLYVAMTRAKNHLFITGCCDTKKLRNNTCAFAIKSSNNFLEMILSAFSSAEIDALATMNAHLTVPLAVDNNLEVNVYSKIDYKKANTENIARKLENCNIDTKFYDLLTKNCGYAYKFDKSTTLALKNTVTALNREADEMESVNPVPRDFHITENTSGISTEVGIAYHKAMQLIDFDLPNVEAVKNYLIGKLNDREFELVDPAKIFIAIQNIRPLLEGARVYREQQFMMRAKHCDLVKNSTITDEILLQGVIDLIIVKNNEIILLDYKTSGSHNIEKTAQNYIMQLNCYSKAISGAMHAKVSQKFLYFFLQERLILIDN